MTLTVVPLLVGTAPDERIALTGDLLPFFIFVVLGGRQPVVVDTGTPGREEVKWRNGDEAGAGRGPGASGHAAGHRRRSLRG